MASSLHNIQTKPQIVRTNCQVRTICPQSGEAREALAKRLESRTLKMPSGCWEFQGTRTGANGYGQMSLGGGKRLGTHRIAWELANGRPVPDGQRVCHSCDNAACVNPAHLFLGSQAENMHDAVRKGRKNVYGIQKLNAEQVYAIRALVVQGERQIDIARAFGIARNTVSGIANRKSWAHLRQPLELETVRFVRLPIRGEVS